MKLEECVERRDLNASKLARLTGYSPTYVQRILSGRQVPGVKFLRAIERLDVEQIKKYRETNESMEELQSFIIS